ncbi:hypothetical protein P4475_17215 [Halalkalibacterium halodurans]|uniref:hypothetical protein n=1 Tax=Halalkalibacterium halodurans TaxID=86665 RepID=UPI002E1E729C|nr:hypothetical protein [Halalkalibacterium halodurans]
MAEVYIYHGPAHTFTNNKYSDVTVERSTTLYNGQLFYLTSRQWLAHSGYVYNYSSGWTQFTVHGRESFGNQVTIRGDANHRGTLTQLWNWNCRQYGLCRNGGSHYSLRRDTSYYRRSGGQWDDQSRLRAGERVVIGSGQGYTINNNFSSFPYIRMYGYITSNGTFRETFGRYIYNNPTARPQNYAINTY